MNFVTARLELLVLGLEALPWIGLGATWFVGSYQVGSIITASSNSQMLLTVVLFGSLYPVGVVVDRVSDLLLDAFRVKWRLMHHRYFARMARADVEFTLLRALARIGGLSGFMEYSMGNLRIIRGSVLNGFLAMIFGALSLLPLGPMIVSRRVAWLVLIGGSVLWIVCLPIYAVGQSVQERRRDYLVQLLAGPTSSIQVSR